MVNTHSYPFSDGYAEPVASDVDVTAHQRLRRDGQRYTENRRTLVDVLVEAGGPLTIPEILEQRPELAQSSAYRNLAVLERAGVVRRILTTDDWARYELAEDLTEHHHHLICASCGDVRDFTVSPELEGDLDQALGRIAREHGFSADHHRLDLVGTCADCG